MEKFYYSVKRGDTALKIAERFSIPVTVLIRDNALSAEVYEGQVLVVINRGGFLYTVRPEDTLKSIAKKFDKQESEIRVQNGLDYIFYGIKILL
ncbi:MAG: LysM peptidoglycan-binding domain-containing protein [Clostridia bacterium]|nr:LysM peptidoglycan-binding domain-containing protein [Clostridia bacterium]